MGNKSHTNYKKRTLEACREMSAAKAAAGLRAHAGRINQEELAKRRGEIPEDTRTLTARVFGDPIPNDPRCPWRPRVNLDAKQGAPHV